MEARIGNVMLVAESAGERSAEEAALLLGVLVVAGLMIGVIEYIQGDRR